MNLKKMIRIFTFISCLYGKLLLCQASILVRTVPGGSAKMTWKVSEMELIGKEIINVVCYYSASSEQVYVNFLKNIPHQDYEERIRKMNFTESNEFGFELFDIQEADVDGYYWCVLATNTSKTIDTDWLSIVIDYIDSVTVKNTSFPILTCSAEARSVPSKHGANMTYEWLSGPPEITSEASVVGSQRDLDLSKLNNTERLKVRCRVTYGAQMNDSDEFIFNGSPETDQYTHSTETALMAATTPTIEATSKSESQEFLYLIIGLMSGVAFVSGVIIFYLCLNRIKAICRPGRNLPPDHHKLHPQIDVQSDIMSTTTCQPMPLQPAKPMVDAVYAEVRDSCLIPESPLGMIAPTLPNGHPTSRPPATWMRPRERMQRERVHFNRRSRSVDFFHALTEQPRPTTVKLKHPPYQDSAENFMTVPACGIYTCRQPERGPQLTKRLSKSVGMLNSMQFSHDSDGKVRRQSAQIDVIVDNPQYEGVISEYDPEPSGISEEMQRFNLETSSSMMMDVDRSGSSRDLYSLATSVQDACEETSRQSAQMDIIVDNPQYQCIAVGNDTPVEQSDNTQHRLHNESSNVPEGDAPYSTLPGQKTTRGRKEHADHSVEIQLGFDECPYQLERSEPVKGKKLYLGSKSSLVDSAPVEERLGSSRDIYTLAKSAQDGGDRTHDDRRNTDSLPKKYEFSTAPSINHRTDPQISDSIDEGCYSEDGYVSAEFTFLA